MEFRSPNNGDGKGNGFGFVDRTEILEVEGPLFFFKEAFDEVYVDLLALSHNRDQIGSYIMYGLSIFMKYGYYSAISTCAKNVKVHHRDFHIFRPYSHYSISAHLSIYIFIKCSLILSLGVANHTQHKRKSTIDK